MSAAPIPFLDLSEQFKDLESEWLSSIKRIGASGAFVLGPNVSAFEEEFARFVGTRFAVALANGTDALLLSLRAMDIGPGDEVITTPYTFFASAEAVNMVGARPVFIDIEADSFNLDPRKVESVISPRTRAILPVHIFGHPARVLELKQIADDLGISVIEDCAQAFGAKVGDTCVGAVGVTGTFSFYPTKILGCYGDGGMVTTNDDDLDRKLRRLRNHCALRPFVHDGIGFNSRLDEIQAALLRIKLRDVNAAIASRRQIAAWYSDEFANTAVVAPSSQPGCQHVYNLYTVRLPNRDRVAQALKDTSIGYSICYPQPLHLQPVYQEMNYKPGSLPVSERAASECISLPIFPGMSKSQVERVCEVVKQACC